MIDITLICLGKIKEKFLVDAINEYTKRIKPLGNLNIIELKEINTDDSNKNLIEEGKNILKTIRGSIPATRSRRSSPNAEPASLP